MEEASNPKNATKPTAAEENFEDLTEEFRDTTWNATASSETLKSREEFLRDHAVLPLPLPAMGSTCADLAEFDLSDADVCYLCSTAFTHEMLERWSAHAARSLRAGSRVITLSKPLSHRAFELERSLRCDTSWTGDSDEPAFVHRVLDAAWLDGAGRLVAKGLASEGCRTAWSFAGEG